MNDQILRRLSAFGPGETVVDVITGREYRL